jgi:spoIIIJ-associated protein
MPQPSNPFVRSGTLDRAAVTRALEQWLAKVLPKSGLKLRCTIKAAAPGVAPAAEFENPEVNVLFEGPDTGLLTAHGAELLLALEYLAVRSLRLDPQFFDRIRFDAGGYRAGRIEELKLAAKVAADRVIESKQPFRLNPMAARERRIVHLALKDVPGIRTASEGAGEERQVVILPATK